MRAVAAEVPPGASVLELCCGPATLYQRYLRGRVSGYVGLDVNAGFVSHAAPPRASTPASSTCAAPEALPGADVAIIQASLYHFLPARRARRRSDARCGAGAGDRVRAGPQSRLERPAGRRADRQARRRPRRRRSRIALRRAADRCWPATRRIGASDPGRAGTGLCRSAIDRRARRRAASRCRSLRPARSAPGPRSSIRNSGRFLTCSKIRPTYSPTTPTLTMMNPASTSSSTARLV